MNESYECTFYTYSVDAVRFTLFWQEKLGSSYLLHFMDAGSLEVRHRANVLSVLSGFFFCFELVSCQRAIGKHRYGLQDKVVGSHVIICLVQCVLIHAPKRKGTLECPNMFGRELLVAMCLIQRF